ncbi:hypothetical protein ABZ864_47565 [Streptomyces sp. NPDC047082]
MSTRTAGSTAGAGGVLFRRLLRFRETAFVQFGRARAGMLVSWAK